MMADNQDTTKEEPIDRHTAQTAAFLGRRAEPAEISGVATFPASDHALYITGPVTAVDGGVTANAR
jgi:NAD(P)-dependent dehydrogenase (short-subunit alcohol dehydrogenase family)